MKFILNSESRPAAKRDGMNARIKAARNRDLSGNRRSLIGLGVVGSLLATCIGGSLYGLNRAEHGIRGLFADEAPGSADPPGANEPATSPVAARPSSAPSKKTGTLASQPLRLREAQKAIEGAMTKANIPVLPADSTILHPQNEEGLERIIQDHRNRYSVRFNVPPEQAAGYTDCSLVVHQTRGSEFVQAASVQQAVSSLAAKQMVDAGAACHDVLVQGFAHSPGYHRLDGF